MAPSVKEKFSLQLCVSLLCICLIISAVVLIYRGGLLRWADNYFYDLRFRWRGNVSPPEHVVLVLMDQPSAEILGRSKASWSRRQMADALTNLCAAGAEVIGLDMLFLEPDPDPGADLALAAAMEQCGNIVLARGSSAFGGEVSAIAPFQEAMIGDGFIDFFLDDDEVLRRVRYLNAKPLADGSLELLPSFSLELVRVYLNLDFSFDFADEKNLVMGHKNGNHLMLPQPELIVDYRGDYAAFTNIAYSDAVLDRFDHEAVAGKLVLIGSSLATEKDIFTTPFTRFREPSADFKDKFGDLVQGVIGAKDLGVACHGHAAETMLSRSFIRQLPKANIIIVTILAGLIGAAFYLPRLSLRWETALLASGLAGVFIAGHLAFIRQRIWADISPLLLVLIAQYVSGALIQKTFERRKSVRVTRLFGKYVSKSVVDELIKGKMDTNLDGRNAELTILFSDLRNFTAISERLGAKNTGLLLNHYFSEMIPVIFRNQGTLDKLMGDAIMAFFGAPVAMPDHPARGAEAALNIIETLTALRKTDTPGMESLDAGVGLNTGTVIVGNLGSDEFMDYTIIGDAVNLASRLEGLNKVYGTRIIVSEFTAAGLDDRFLLRELDRVRVKGKKEVVTLFELMGRRENAGPERLELLEIYTNGLAAYQARQWDRAAALFTAALNLAPEDGPSKLYMSRISQFKGNPLDELWDCVVTFENK